MSDLNTNTLSVNYALDENIGAARTAQIYTEIDGEIVDVMNITQEASAAYGGSSDSNLDIEIDMSGETQAAIDELNNKIALCRNSLSTAAYSRALDAAVKMIEYYESIKDTEADSYGCVTINDEYSLNALQAYYNELNYLLEQYNKANHFLAELTGTISDLKISNLNRSLNNLEKDYNDIKEITKSTSEITEAFIESVRNDNLVSSDEQAAFKLKLDEISAEYIAIIESVESLLRLYEEAATPKVDENGVEHETPFISEDVKMYLEKLGELYESYKAEYDKAYKTLTYYVDPSTERDEFGNVAMHPDYDINLLPEFYIIRKSLLDVYYEANAYYTTYNRFGSKTTYIGENGIYSGTISTDNLRGWCIEGLTVQSGEKTELPSDLEWYKYNPNAASVEDAFTKINKDYRDEEGNPVISGPKWQIYKDGTGHLAKGNFRWTNEEVLFGDGAKISIKREDGSTENVPLGSAFSDMGNKIDEYVNEWKNDNLVSYLEQKTMLTVFDEISAEYKQVYSSINNLINSLRSAQEQITSNETNSVINTYINSLDTSSYKEAADLAQSVILYYTSDETERSITGAVLISDEYPLSAITDYYKSRENIVEKYNIATNFYTITVNTILNGIVDDVKMTAETMKNYIEAWTSDSVVSPAELSEFRVLYNTIKSESVDILSKVEKLSAQYDAYISNIDENNVVLKTTMQENRDSLKTDNYVEKSDDVVKTLEYYIKYVVTEEEIALYGGEFIPINTEYPLDDIYDYYTIKDDLVKNYNKALAAYTTYTSADLVDRINNISTTNKNIDKFIEDWADEDNINPAEKSQMEIIQKEIEAEVPGIIAAVNVTLENILDIEKDIKENTNDELLLNSVGEFIKGLDSTNTTSDTANFIAKKDLALSTIIYYTTAVDETLSDGFVAINPEKPLSAITDYYTAREAVKITVNKANAFSNMYNNSSIKNILNELSNVDDKLKEVDDYITAWTKDSNIDPSEQTEMLYVKKEIEAEKLTILTSAAVTKNNLVSVENAIINSESEIDDTMLDDIAEIKLALDATDFIAKYDAAINVIEYYTSNLNKDENGFVAIDNEKYPLDAIDKYYNARESLVLAMNRADSLCTNYNSIATNNVMNTLSKTNELIDGYINDWKDDKKISPAEKSELSRILSEITVEETNILFAVNEIVTKLTTILSEDSDRLTNEFKNKINSIIANLDTTNFESIVDTAKEVLSYYTNPQASELYADANGFISIVEDKKLESIDAYYDAREEIKKHYNIAMTLYGDYNRANIKDLDYTLENMSDEMQKLLADICDDNKIDGGEKIQFEMILGRIKTEVSSLKSSSDAMRSNLNSLESMTNGMYTTEINKHLADISYADMESCAKSAISTLEYYINKELVNGYIDISSAYPLSNVTNYYSAAARLQSAINNANGFYTKVTGDYSNKQISKVQQELNTLEADLKTLESIAGASSETMNDWIAKWTDDNSLNGDELKALADKVEAIKSESTVITETAQRTLTALRERFNDGLNRDVLEKYYNDLNSALTKYQSDYSAVITVYKYYSSQISNDLPTIDEYGNVALNDAYNLTVFNTYAASKQSIITINTEAASFVTSYHRFGSKLVNIGEDGIYAGELMGDQITGGCIRGIAVQSGETTSLPSNVKWQKYNANDFTFTESTGGNGPRWQIYKDGSGHLADGQISWTGSTVTLGDKVTINWNNVDGGQDALNNESKELADKIAKEKELLEDALERNNLELTNNFNTLRDNVNDFKLTTSNKLVEMSNKLDIFETTSKGDSAEIAAMISKITSDKYIDADELKNINNQYTSMLENYNKLYNAIEDLINDYNTWKTDITKNESLGDEAEINAIIADLNSFKTSIAASYNSAKTVCEYYLGNPEKTEDGFIEVHDGYQLNTIAEYEALENKISIDCSTFATYYLTYNRWGTKTTFISKEGIYSGTISGDQIKGKEITGVTVQSNNKGEAFKLESDGNFKLGKGAIEYNATTNKLTIKGSNVNIGGSVNIDGTATINGEAILTGIENSGDENLKKFGTLISDYIEADKIVGGEITGDTISGKTIQSSITVRVDGKDIPTWQITNDGEGHLASKNIYWNDNGDLTVKGEILGTIGNSGSTSTDGNVDINGHLNIKNGSNIVTALTPNLKYDTVTDASNNNVQRYVTLSSGVHQSNKVYVWNSDGNNVNPPYTTIYTTYDYANTKNGTEVYDVFKLTSDQSFVHVNDMCTVSSREVSSTGEYSENSKCVISLHQGSVVYKYNLSTSTKDVNENQRKQLANTNILSDGTIYTNSLIAKSGNYYGTIESDGKFYGVLDGASGYIKNCNISSSDVTINSNKCFRVYKPNTGTSTASTEEETNELLNITPSLTLSSTAKQSYYVNAGSIYHQHRKNGDITWKETTKIATINVKNNDSIYIPATKVYATVYQSRAKNIDKSNPKVRIYVKFADGKTADISNGTVSLTKDSNSKKYGGNQYTWNLNISAKTISAIAAGTAYVYMESSVWLNDKQTWDYSACTFGYEIKDNIIVTPKSGGNNMLYNTINIGENGLIIYTKSGNVIQTTNGTIDLLSQDGRHGLRISNNGIEIKRDGGNWTDL